MEEIQEIASSGHTTFDSAIVMASLASIAVVIRFISKAGTKARYSLDDLAIGLSLAAFWAYVAMLCWAVFEAGGGLDMPNIKQMQLANLSLYIKALTIGSTFFVLVTTTTKFSILLYYRRIFTTQLFKRAVLVVGLVTAATFLTGELGITLQCTPVQFLWDPLLQGHCINFDVFFLVIGLVDLLLNVTILCLPLRMIPGLKLPLKHKINLSLIFLLGGFVCITSIFLATLAYRRGQTTVDFVKGLLWSNIHLGTGIICACLPTYRPLLSKCASSLASMQRQYKGLFSSHRRALNSERGLDLGENGASGLTSGKASSSQDDRERSMGYTVNDGHERYLAGKGGYPLDKTSAESIV